MKTSTICLLLDSARGQYIPRDFVQSFDLEKFQGVSDWAKKECENPDNGHYWDAWESILNNTRYIEDGRVFILHHDGDLWLLCIDEMSDEDKFNFFGDC